MSLSNSDVRVYAISHGVYLYQIAERYGVNDGNFSRKLRKELPKAEKQRIFAIIDQIAAEQSTTTV